MRLELYFHLSLLREQPAIRIDPSCCLGADAAVRVLSPSACAFHRQVERDRTVQKTDPFIGSHKS